MYKVFIESVCIYQTPQIDDAVAFALGIHRSSNVPHKVGVIEVGSLKPTITFERSALKDENPSHDVRS